MRSQPRSYKGNRPDLNTNLTPLTFGLSRIDAHLKNRRIHPNASTFSHNTKLYCFDLRAMDLLVFPLLLL